MSNTARSYLHSGKIRKTKTKFLPENIKVFLANKMIDIFGISICFLSFLLALTLLSYSYIDPSFNSATTSTEEIQNILGIFGAYTADLLLQSFGFVSVIFPAILFLVAWRILKRQYIVNIGFKISAFLLSIILFCLALSTVPQDWLGLEHLYVGGSVGVLLLNIVADFLQKIDIIAPTILIGGIAFVPAILLSLYATDISILDIIKAITKIISLFVLAIYPIFKLLNLISLRKTKSNEEKAKRLVPKKQSVVKSPKTKTVKQSKRIKKEKQPELIFNNDGEIGWKLPEISLLDEPPMNRAISHSPENLQKNAEMLQNVLNDFGVEGEIIGVNPGPIITLYELEPAPGTKSSRVINLADDIARSMSTTTVRVAVIPGKNAIGIELPNIKREIVFLKEVLSSENYERTTAKLPLVLGKTIGGEPVIADLAKMPHLLVAGTTGSGKSVAVNTMILSLLYKFSPEQCRLIMIDPKMLELSVYDDIPHLLTPVVTEPHKAVTALKWAVGEMEDRYRAMSKLGVRNIEGYNSRIRDAQKKGEVITNKIQTGFDHETGKPVFEEQPISLVEMPYIVVIVDEFADLMLVAGKEVEACIQRLAQMARAAGIHLIMATQRPSVDVITGVIKANFPTRISFQVTSKIDSRTILGEGGAEQLLGRGDMLFMPAGEKIIRVHGPFVDDAEVENVVNYLKAQGEPDYVDNVTFVSDDDSGFKGIVAGGSDYDELYDQALALILRERKASTSFIQRHLQIGYNRAARIIDQLEADGVIGPANHVGKREILMEDHTGEYS